MTTRRSGRGGTRSPSRRSYYWAGVQWPTTAVPVSTSQLVLTMLDNTASEFMPGTLIRIRGVINLQNGGTGGDAGFVEVGLKILDHQVNDALTLGADDRAIDTHEEDIARRHLWADYAFLPQAITDTAERESPPLRIVVDVKAKVKIQASGKQFVSLFMSASAVNRAETSGYLRALYMR